MAGFGKRRVSDRSSGPATLVAEGCTIEGTFSGANDLLISGTVVGDSQLDGVVTIARSGLWRGTLGARHVIISGTVEGDIVASGRIEISASARIAGTVTGDKIAVAEGAVIEGDMRITGGDGARSTFNEKRVDDDAPAIEKAS